MASDDGVCAGGPGPSASRLNANGHNVVDYEAESERA